MCAGGVALSVSYEQCHRDFVGILSRILLHYGFVISPDAVAAAAKASSFERMRRLELSDLAGVEWLRLRNGSPKVRRGKVGNFISELNQTDIVYLNSIFSNTELGMR